MQLKIDNEFQNLIPPLTKEEFEQLKANLISDGCMESLFVREERTGTAVIHGMRGS